MKPPTHVDCHHCGKKMRPKWMKKFELPPGITMMGFSVCKYCERPAFHIQGDPQAVEEVTQSFEENMDFKDADLQATNVRTGKPVLDS